MRGDDRIRTGGEGVADITAAYNFYSVFNALAGLRNTVHLYLHSNR